MCNIFLIARASIRTGVYYFNLKRVLIEHYRR